MNNATSLLRVPGLLGAPVVHPITVNGHHGLSRRHSSGRHSRHNQINDMLCRAWFVSFETLATREARGLCTNTDKRPDGVTQLPWRRGRCLPWDATCTQTRSHRVTYLQATTRLVLPTSSHVYTLYRCYQNVGRLGKARSSRHVNNEIGRWIAAMAHEPRSVANL